MKKPRTALVAIVLTFLAFSSSCFGPMNATQRVHTWNREIENRWGGEGVFLVFRVAYVYTLAFVGDILIFNSIEFWGGDNPIDPPSMERVKAIKDRDAARMSDAPKEE